MKELTEFWTYEDEFFDELYALSVINFDAPIEKSLLNPLYYNDTSTETLISNSIWIDEG